MIPLQIDIRQRATLVAALAFWQASGLTCRPLRPRSLEVLASGNGQFPPLDSAEVESLLGILSDALRNRDADDRANADAADRTTAILAAA